MYCMWIFFLFPSNFFTDDITPGSYDSELKYFYLPKEDETTPPTPGNRSEKLLTLLLPRDILLDVRVKA